MRRPADLRALQERKTLLVEAFAEGDLVLNASEDLRFHEMIWEPAGNPWLLVALRRIAIPFFART